MTENDGGGIIYEAEVVAGGVIHLMDPGLYLYGDGDIAHYSYDSRIESICSKKSP